MVKKRGNGEGSVYQRKDGRWVGQYKIRTQDGTVKNRYVYAGTRKEAATKVAQAIAEREAGVVYDCGSMTVGEYLDRWLGALRGTVRERTWVRAEVDVRGHLKPAFGKTRLDRLNALQVQDLYGAKLASGLRRVQDHEREGRAQH